MFIKKYGINNITNVYIEFTIYLFKEDFLVSVVVMIIERKRV